MASRKQNASTKGGAHFTKLAGGVKGQTKEIFRCGVKHTSKLRKELHANGMALRDTSGRTQCETLLRVLQYLGDRGINTPEGVACGFYRIATRIQELEASGWVIASRRERLVGPDGLAHNGIARYVLVGHGGMLSDPQGSLDLEASC
ncbi:helix-turn-helix domain-containing protein [Rugamonas rubra]|uniref:Helix-turn-helix domain-containing protein n=1 Tax=Rugamonas rubra TaxID=758825 RepID=A0A1I4SJ39_9BURK|nr:helix-turn-helix domain-containing protein [Rugamonas rubra]SFM64528.1 Helix-turn-helix domain-containing protein [Rugamonas rubra]